MKELIDPVLYGCLTNVEIRQYAQKEAEKNMLHLK